MACDGPFGDSGAFLQPPPDFLRDYLSSLPSHRFVIRARDTAPCEPSSSTYYTENSCDTTSPEGMDVPNQEMKQIWLDVVGEIVVQLPADGSSPSGIADWGNPPSIRGVMFEHESSTVLESEELGSLVSITIDVQDDVGGSSAPNLDLYDDECIAAREQDPYSCGPFSGGKAMHMRAWPWDLLRITDTEVCHASGGFSNELNKHVERVKTSDVNGEEYCWPRRQLDCLTVWRAGEGTTPSDCGPNEVTLPAQPPGDPNDGGLPNG
jgi:hypothetical protein